MHGPRPQGIVESGHLDAFWGHAWADMSDGDKGVAIFSQPGLIGYRIADGAFQHVLHKIIPPNRQAGARWANDSRSGLGRQRMNFSVLPHAGDWKAAKLYREIEKVRQPIDGEDVLYPLAGDAPDTQRGLAVGPDNVMLSAYFQDQGATICRLYENQGAPTRARVDLPADFSAATICNLLGDPIDDVRTVTLEANHLELDLGPWEIVTLRLT